MKAILKNPMFYLILIVLSIILFRYMNGEVNSFVWGLTILLFSQIIVLIITLKQSNKQIQKRAN